MHALVSIHDVMPHTLDRVQSILDTMPHIPANMVTLLVVPGLDWQSSQIETLRGWQQAGYILAGHGWSHKVRQIRGLHHSLHAAFISRTAAEHLSLTQAEIANLMQDCHAWFSEKQLSLPDLYVPPAWAMGKANEITLENSPFTYFETTSGIVDSKTGRKIILPLAGFEADNLFRACSLTLWNSLNYTASTASRPLRLAIHPFDPELKLKNALQRMISKVSEPMDYHSLFH